MASTDTRAESVELAPGDRVVVYKTRALEGVEESADIIEGEATLSHRLAGDADGELWELRFEGTPGAYIRWVSVSDRVAPAEELEELEG
jgi:hypothetical protein